MATDSAIDRSQDPKYQPQQQNAMKSSKRDCETCGRSFQRPEHLRRHLRTHTKEKPYVCPCGQSFTRQDLLARHKRLAHASNGLAPLATSAPPLKASRSCDATTVDATKQTMTSHGAATVNPVGKEALAMEPGFPIPVPKDDIFDSFIDFNSFMNTAGLDFEVDVPEFDLEKSLESFDPILYPDVPAEPATYAELIPDPESGQDDFQELKPLIQPWRVNEHERNKLQHALFTFKVDQALILPSRVSMSRYIAGFIEGYCHHHPFIHIPSFHIESYRKCPALILAIMAVGAQYRHEPVQAKRFYQAARSLAIQPQSREARPEIDMAMKVVLLLATFATWQADPGHLQDAFEYQSRLTRLVREDGLTEEHDSDGDDWRKWIAAESNRRTKLTAFCVLSLQTVIFGVPPALLASEFDLRLPRSCKEWLAPSAFEWRGARDLSLPDVSVQPALDALVHVSDEPGLLMSPFGNYVLVLALHQQIFYSGHVPTAQTSSSSEDPLIHALERSLDKWKSQWQRAPESALDLCSAKGSLAFTATALFGVAHLRLHWRVDLANAMRLGNPEQLAQYVRHASMPRRGDHLLQSLLHAVHALSIPIQLGVNYLRKNQAYYWSAVHAACNFEFAVFLSKWLAEMAETLAVVQPSDLEQRILSWLRHILNEAAESLNTLPHLEPSLQSMNRVMLEVWSRMFEDCNSPWPFVGMIGTTLRRLADVAAFGD